MNEQQLDLNPKPNKCSKCGTTEAKDYVVSGSVLCSPCWVGETNEQQLEQKWREDYQRDVLKTNNFVISNDEFLNAKAQAGWLIYLAARKKGQEEIERDYVKHSDFLDVEGGLTKQIQSLTQQIKDLNDTYANQLLKYEDSLQEKEQQLKEKDAEIVSYQGSCGMHTINEIKNLTQLIIEARNIMVNDYDADYVTNVEKWCEKTKEIKKMSETKELSEEAKKAAIIAAKEQIDRIATNVIKEVVQNFPKEEQFLILGRITNSLVDICYKPMITNYLHYKSEQFDEVAKTL